MVIMAMEHIMLEEYLPSGYDPPDPVHINIDRDDLAPMETIMYQVEGWYTESNEIYWRSHIDAVSTTKKEHDEIGLITVTEAYMFPYDPLAPEDQIGPSILHTWCKVHDTLHPIVNSAIAHASDIDFPVFFQMTMNLNLIASVIGAPTVNAVF